MSLATIVKGNTFSLAIPLQVYAVGDGEVVLRDYTPESGDNITIRLKGDRRNYAYIPSTNGSTAFIHLEGSEVVGVYAVEVEIVKDDDSKLTSMRFDQLSIVESIDELNEGQITEGIEQGAIYLDPEIFIAGKDGRGIVSIVKTATSGLVDTYTITYTDNTTSTFNVTNGANGINGQDGVDGADGVGIASIAKTGTQGLVDTYTITMTNGTTYTYQVTNGKDGENGRDGEDGQDGTDGVGIVSITKTSTSGLVDTYTILLTNGTTYTFNVTNGKDGEDAQPPYFVNLTWDNSTQKYTADKTPEECQNAYEAGQMVIFRDRGTYQSVNTFEWLMSTSQYYPQPNLRMVFAYRIEGKDNDGNLRISQLHYQSQIVTTLTVTTITAQQLLESGVNIKTINSTSLLGSGNISVVSQAELTNYCPIIEDTRSSKVSNITGVATFGTNGTIPDGQRIYIHFKYDTAGPISTLTLTLSDETTTSAIPLKASYHNSGNYNVNADLKCNAGSYMPFIYDATNSVWHSLGDIDYYTTPFTMSAEYVQAGTSTIGFIVPPKLFHDSAYIVEESYTSGSLKANKMYDFGTVSSLTIPSLDATNDLVSNALNFYALRFIAGADNISITFPTGVIVDDTPTINTGDYVEIMINLYVENNTNHFYASIKVWQAQ